MINILVCGFTDKCGGIENTIMNFFREFNNKKFHFDFLCTSKNPAFKGEIIQNGSSIFYISSRKNNFFRNITDLIKIKKKLKENNYDILWDNENSLTNLSYLKLAKSLKIKKIILHSHMDKYSRRGVLRYPFLILHFINKMFIQNYATNFWAASYEAGKYLFTKKILCSKKFKIIHNAIDVYKFRFNPKKRSEIRKKLNLNNCLVIGSVGRLSHEKNHEFIIRICAEMNKKIKTKLILVGDGVQKNNLIKIAKKLNILNYVIFVGLSNEVTSYLDAMDIFIFPSLYEGFGISALEAQTNGLPVYCSNYIPKIIKITKNVKFINLSLSANSWSKIILGSFPENKINRNKIYKEIINSNFDIKNESKKLEKIFYE